MVDDKTHCIAQQWCCNIVGLLVGEPPQMGNWQVANRVACEKLWLNVNAVQSGTSIFHAACAVGTRYSDVCRHVPYTEEASYASTALFIWFLFASFRKGIFLMHQPSYHIRSWPGCRQTPLDFLLKGKLRLSPDTDPEPVGLELIPCYGTKVWTVRPSP